MEEQKLIKRKQKALNCSNKRQTAEICTELGDIYNRKGQYEKALAEYETSASIYRELKMKLENAQSHRMIGEMYMLLADFKNALQHEEIYLNIARELNNKLEEQRALATLGRTYLLQGQSLDDSKVSLKLFQIAEKSFIKSLSVCESLKGKISNQEIMDMKARLLLNIGVVSEQMGNFGRATEFFQKSISICKNCDLHGLLVQCYITEGIMLTSKHGDHSKAIMCFNLALEIAGRLENKVIKQSEILFLKAETLCKMSDFQSAKGVLVKAWKMKTPNEEERNDIEKTLKIVAALCYTEDLLVTTNSDDFRTLKKLYEKIADGACLLKNYEKGVHFYLKMLECAEKCGDSEKDLTPIYVSLYQTYKDLKEYEKALEYNQKEFELIQNIPKEAFVTLLNIAELMILAKKSYKDIENIFRKARMQAMKLKDKRKELKTLNLLKDAQKTFGMLELIKSTDDEISKLGVVNQGSEESSDESCDESGTPDIGDDICLEDLTDASDNEKSEINIKKTTRTRGKSFTIKKNSKGETQLHQACISGNILLVTRLISQGHPINVRDNAGWLPIHEACIHGHKNVVEILIKNGASVNDRGGTQCDGITPIYDAASNGHLEIVELLLDNGASPTIKNDHGESPLEVLTKWRQSNRVNPSDNIFYETLCARMQVCLDKAGNLSQNSGKCTQKKMEFENMNENIEHLLDNSESDGEQSRSPTIPFRSRKIISDESSDSSDFRTFENCQKNKTIAVNEYKNAISALRSKHSNVDVIRRSPRGKKKTALLSADEVGEDWLENDLPAHSKRRRKLSVEFLHPPKRKTNNVKASPVKVVENANKTTETSYNDDLIEPDIPISDDSMESFTSSENKDVSGTGRSSKSKFKRQASLLRVGFSRNKVSRLSGEDDKDDEILDDNILVENLQFLQEPDSTTDSNQGNFSSSKSFFNSSQDTCKSAIEETSNFEASLPPVTIKVKIHDRVLLIAVAAEKMNFLTVDWLIQETCKRFYNIEGVKPTLNLLTNDGALLANGDPLTVILGNSEITANITNWNLPPLGSRYVECCTHCDIDVDDHIKNILEKSQATQILSLSSLNLDFITIKPVFKALNHQMNLKNIILSNNNIGNDGISLLLQSLPTLTHIESLNLSQNSIDSDGIKMILSLFEKSPNICQQLRALNVSYNFLGKAGFDHIARLTKYVKFKDLNLKHTFIEYKASEMNDMPNFQYLEHLDISYNNFEEDAIYLLLKKVNKSSLTSLKMEKSEIKTFLSNNLSDELFFNLTELNLSRCNITDSDVIDVLRLSLKCEKLQRVHLKYNDNITFTSFKKLLSNKNFIYVDLEGCSSILDNVEESDLQTNLFFGEWENRINYLRISPKDTPQNMKYTDMISNMWNDCWKNKAVITKCPYGLIEFSKSV